MVSTVSADDTVSFALLFCSLAVESSSGGSSIRSTNSGSFSECGRSTREEIAR